MDNRLENLRYATRTENIRYIYEVVNPHGAFIRRPRPPAGEGAVWRNIGVFLDQSDLSQYEVSDQGGVCDATSEEKRFLNFTNDGYVYVQMTINGIFKKYLVHRLMAYTFLRDDYDADNKNINSECDGNRSVNLKWCSQQENMIHARGVPTVVKVMGTNQIFRMKSIAEVKRFFSSTFNRKAISKGETRIVDSYYNDDLVKLFIQKAADYDEDEGSDDDDGSIEDGE